MSTKAQVKTPAKTPAAPVAARIIQPPVAEPEHEAARPDIAAQLEGAARLGHRFGAFGVDGAGLPIIQRQELPEEEEEELQLKREPAAVQRQELPEEEEELMMKPEEGRVGPQGGPVPPEVEAAIHHARGGGQPLEGALQEQMSASLGYGFSGVRVHTDSEADALNQQLQAKAFTTGSDVFFRRREYNPGSSGSRELIAHELTHVVQQSTGRVGGEGSGMVVRPVGDAFEQEAEHAATQRTESHEKSKAGDATRAVVRPYLASTADILALQRTVGNWAVQRLLAQSQSGADRFILENSPHAKYTTASGGCQPLARAAKAQKRERTGDEFSGGRAPAAARKTREKNVRRSKSFPNDPDIIIESGEYEPAHSDGRAKKDSESAKTGAPVDQGPGRTVIQRYFEDKARPGWRVSQGGKIGWNENRKQWLLAYRNDVKSANEAIRAKGGVVRLRMDSIRPGGSGAVTAEIDQSVLDEQVGNKWAELATRLRQMSIQRGRMVTYADCFRSASLVAGVKPEFEEETFLQPQINQGQVTFKMMSREEAMDNYAVSSPGERAAVSFLQEALPKFGEWLERQGRKEGKSEAPLARSTEPYIAVNHIIQRCKAAAKNRGKGKAGRDALFNIYRLITDNDTLRDAFEQMFSINAKAVPEVGDMLVQVNDPLEAIEENEKAETGREKENEERLARYAQEGGKAEQYPPEPGAVPGRGGAWNFHWAGVVMKDGGDYVTLENFAIELDEMTEQVLAMNMDAFQREYATVKIADPDVTRRFYSTSVRRNLRYDKRDILNADWTFRLYGNAEQQSFHKVAKATPEATKHVITLVVGKKGGTR